MEQAAHLFARLHRLGIATAAAIFASALALAIGTGSASAAPTVAVLGAATPATPACPQACSATGKTTLFQSSIGKLANPFVVPYKAKLVAWSIKLSAPSSTRTDGNQSQIEFFNDLFGGGPSARIAVLKPIQKKVKVGKPIYKLKSQGPVEDLMPFLGTTTTFALQKPLTVKPGQIVGLTLPTWAPAFAVGQPGNTVWRASRQKSKCADKYVPDGRSQEAIGSQRAFGCPYKGTRLLYSATIVKDPNAAPPVKKKKPKK